MRSLKSGKHVFSSATLKPAALLQVKLLHDARVDEHCIPTAADAKAFVGGVHLQAALLRELSGTISQHCDLVANGLRVLPLAHDEAVVHADAGDGADALRFQLLRFLTETREVLNGDIMTSRDHHVAYKFDAVLVCVNALSPGWNRRA